MEDLEKLFDDACIFAQHIVAALDCLGECRAMNQIFTSPQHKDQYPVARHFYRTAYFAMRFRFHMEVAKLFDSDSHSESFPNFKNRAYHAGLIDATDKSKYSELKGNAQKDIDVIEERRNKIYAHSDKCVFNEPDQYLDEHPFDDKTIETLLYTMLFICNKVIIHLTKDIPARLFSADNNDDFIKLFGYETKSEVALRKFFENRDDHP